MTTILPSDVSTHCATISTQQINCLGVVLAGGLSSRMGQDKAKLIRKDQSTVAQQTMLEFSKKTLKDAGVDQIVVSGDEYDITDKIKQGGPVAGILSVISAFPQVKSLLILPVDLPFMTTSALQSLKIKGELSHKATYFEGHNIPLYLPNNGYLEIFLANTFSKEHHLDASNSTTKHARFKNKGPSIKSLLTQVPHQSIPCIEHNVLFNSNTPDEWQLVKQQLNI